MDDGRWTWDGAQGTGHRAQRNKRLLFDVAGLALLAEGKFIPLCSTGYQP